MWVYFPLLTMNNVEYFLSSLYVVSIFLYMECRFIPLFIFYWVVCLFINVWTFIYRLWIQILYQICFGKSFSSFSHSLDNIFWRVLFHFDEIQFISFSLIGSAFGMDWWKFDRVSRELSTCDPDNHLFSVAALHGVRCLTRFLPLPT